MGRKVASVAEVRLVTEYGTLYHGRADGHYDVYGGSPINQVVLDAIALARLSPTGQVSFVFSEGTPSQVVFIVKPDSDPNLLVDAFQEKGDQGIRVIGPYPKPA